MNVAEPDVGALTNAFRTGAPSLRGSAVNTDALRRDGGELFAAAERLHEYRRYLARARAAKAAGQATGIDRQVRAYAREAHDDLGVVCAASSRMARALHATGVLSRMAASTVQALHNSGPVSTTQTWRHIVDSTHGRQALHSVGVGDTLVDALDAAVMRFDLSAFADGSRLVVETAVDGRPVQLSMEAAPRPARPAGVVDLVMRGRFAALCDALEHGEPAFLVGTGPIAGDPRIDDLVLLELLRTQREGIRHLRKLEDAGLATYAGGEPGTIALIGVVLLLIGALISIAECGSDDEAGESPSDGCALGAILSFLGAALLLLVGPPPGQPPRVVGGPVIHGPLPDLAGPAT